MVSIPQTNEPVQAQAAQQPVPFTFYQRAQAQIHQLQLFNRLFLCFSALLLPIARVTTVYPHVLFSPCPVLRMFRSLNTHKHMLLGNAGGVFLCVQFSVCARPFQQCHEMINCHEMNTDRVPHCASCLTQLTQHETGRPRKYCSDKCRKTAQRARERKGKEQPERSAKSGESFIVPCTIAEANAFVNRIHRHHGTIPIARFALAVADKTGLIRGVAIVGRPCNTHLDDDWTLEVRRLATDGYKNACSMLLGACWKAAQAIGYRKLITYTLLSESGSSLRAVGWRRITDCGGKPWSSKNRPRTDTPLTYEKKYRWEISLETVTPFQTVRVSEQRMVT